MGCVGRSEQSLLGVTESRHLVDVLNQVDGVEDIDEEDRLGQPMINISTQRDWGSVDLFVLPGFRERTFAGQMVGYDLHSQLMLTTPNMNRLPGTSILISFAL